MENKIVKSELITFMEKNSLNETTQALFINAFGSFLEQAKEWSERAKTLLITDVSQVDEIKSARVGRLALLKVRTSIEAKRKFLKEESLKTGKDIDLVAKFLTSLVLPTEAYLEEQEKFIERENAKIVEKLKAERVELLAPYEADITFIPLDTMAEDLFQKFLADSKMLFQAKIDAAEKQAETERLIKLRADRFSEIKNFANISADLSNADLASFDSDLWEKIIFDLKDKKEKEENALKIENERLKTEQETKDEIRKQRNEQLSPFLMFIRDYDYLLNSNDEDYQKEFLDLQRSASEHFLAENNKLKEEEKLKEERAQRDIEIQKVKNYLLADRKKSLFNLGFSEVNGSMKFGIMEIFIDTLSDDPADIWSENLSNITVNVAKIKADTEAEIQASKGDKEKVKQLIEDLTVIKTRYDFKSKKHQKVFVDTCILIDKIINHVNEKA